MFHIEESLTDEVSPVTVHADFGRDVGCFSVGTVPPPSVHTSRVNFSPTVQKGGPPVPEDDFLRYTLKDNTGSWSAKKRSGIHITPLKQINESTSYRVATYDQNRVLLGGPVGPQYTKSPQWLGYTGRAWAIVQKTTSGDFHYFYESLKLPYIQVPVNHYGNTTEQLKLEIIAKAIDGYDALTDVGELPSTLSLALKLIKTLFNPLRAFRDWVMWARKEAKKSPGASIHVLNKTLAQKWLELQYGIMPVFYSIKDILKLLSEKDIPYMTVRSKRSIDPYVPSRPYGIDHLFDVDDRTISLSAWGKVMFSSDADRLWKRITLNPMRTLWDLTPFSLVVDWFVDVSKYLIAFGSGAKLSAGDKFLISTRTTGSISTELYLRVDGETLEVPAYGWDLPRFHPCADLPAPAWNTWPMRVHSHRPTEIIQPVLRVRTFDNYVRTPFTTKDVSLRFTPSFSNWRRQVSAAAMAYVNLPRLLGSLK